MSNINNFFNVNNNNIKNDNNTSYAYHLFMIIITLYINYNILYWLILINRYECVNINEGLFLKEWFAFSIISQMIILIYFIFNNDNNIVLFISLIIIILGIIMIIRFLIYIHKLQEIANKCSKIRIIMSPFKTYNKYYYIYPYIILIIIGFILLIMNK